MTTPIFSVIFTQANTIGDFNWMIQQPIYNNSLFIFNDNTLCFPKSSSCYCSSGGGNAVIRNYQCTTSKQLAIGIPTGSTSGFTSLSQIINNKTAKEFIDESINRIKLLLKNNYDCIFYSGSNDNSGNLGTGIFNVDKSVVQYITEQIHSLGIYNGNYTSLSQFYKHNDKNTKINNTINKYYILLLIILIVLLFLYFTL